jgi:peptidyl-prolyl cis-trans isomerase SurA
MRLARLVPQALLCGLALTLGSAAARAEVIERVVGVVNEDAILLSELRRRAAPFLESALQGVPEADRKERIKLLYGQLLDALVDEQLIEQAARKMHVTVTTLEVDQAIDNVRLQNKLTREQFFDAVRGQGFTEKQYRQDVRKQILRLKVMNQRVRSRVNISDTTVREAYDDRVRQARKKQRFRAAHVFLALPDPPSATQLAATMEQARTLRGSLNPATFEKTMNEVGGGDLGLLDQGDLPGELEAAQIELEPGQISPPVRGPSGVHIFLLRERQSGSAKVPSFEEARGEIQRELMEGAMDSQEKIFLSGLRRKAVIERRP